MAFDWSLPVDKKIHDELRHKGKKFDVRCIVRGNNLDTDLLLQIRLLGTSCLLRCVCGNISFVTLLEGVTLLIGNCVL